MFLQAITATAKAASPLQGDLGPFGTSIFSSAGGSVLRLVDLPRKTKKGFVISASTEALTGVVFQPFEEVKNDEFLVPISPQVSLARQRYLDESEAAINEQIK